MPHHPPHDRVWGTRFDNLPPSSPPPSPPDLQQPPDAAINDPSLSKADEKPSHGASIFVGNLPCHLSIETLRQLLGEFLSSFAVITNVKVASNTQGFYAFAQCENEAAASKLLHTMKTSPQELFHGRMLRYEATHAHRAIRVSYKAPDARTTGRQDLPTALKLLSPPASRAMVLFDENAKKAHPQESPDVAVTLLSPISCNAETMQRLAAHFGPLETFTLYQGPSPLSDQNHDSLACFGGPKSYPYPHDSPRLPHMDPRCWEIKFKRHEDYWMAFQTFQSIPFISVTRAHTSQAYSRRFNRPPTRATDYPDSSRRMSADYRSFRESGINLHSAPSPTGSVDGGTSAFEGHPSPPCAVGQTDGRLDWSMDLPSLDSTLGFTVELQDSTEVKRAEDDDSTPRVHMSSLSTPPQQDIKTSLDNSSPMLVSSPLTPQTPNFPSTPPNDEPFHRIPHSWHGSDKGSFMVDKDNTALHIPVVSINGPEGWTRSTLWEYFASFGVVKDVRITERISAQNAFALVFFDGPEAAARAMAEQNRFHPVQYRDIYPRRGAFRGRGSRGRGMIGAYRRPNTFRQLPDGSPFQPSFTTFDNGQHQGAIIPQFASLDMSTQDAQDVENKASRSQSPVRELHEPELVSSAPKTGLLETSRQSSSDQETSTEGTYSSVSSLPSSTSALHNGQLYPANGSHFSSTHWQVPPHMFYGYYAPYPGYILPTPPMASPTSDHISTNPASHYWPGMYGGYMNYPAHGLRAGDPPHPSARPPVPALGHFQDERGLVPCYPQDVLCHYMAQCGPQDNVSQGPLTNPHITSSHSTPSSVPQHPFPPPWHQFHAAPSFMGPHSHHQGQPRMAPTGSPFSSVSDNLATKRHHPGHGNNKNRHPRQHSGRY